MMLGSKGILTPLIPDCYVLCTLAILKYHQSMLMVFDAVYQKKRDTNVSPVIIKIYVPTLALSKSGIWVEVLNFLSACQTSSPFHLQNSV